MSGLRKKKLHKSINSKVFQQLLVLSRDYSNQMKKNFNSLLICYAKGIPKLISGCASDLSV